MGEYVLTLSCPDRLGIVHAVSGFCVELACNIRDSQQFGDPDTGRFFMRVHLDGAGGLGELRAAFTSTAARFAMDWTLHDCALRPRVLILVSTQDHCLNDLLYRHRINALPGDLIAIVSNHGTCAPMARSAGIEFHHLPVTAATRSIQEGQLLALVEDLDIDLIVLARYMQILSPAACAQLDGRAINIHHSFLPGFVGARPYHQAYQRGVKLIGATAHYVTADLDAGPIIEQEVARVDHSVSPEQLIAIGRDLESVALARAVTWHLEHRIILNGSKTVVLR
ncbi:MAG: formyltetrahydrofolate deformylase [Actinomycetota bacterium]|nr:formyltetrahydrofolate deformylase [Actinomycetota bacterium]MDP9165997.1 formyltetrahydrofolate deformylase [Actinomycetota bacterium]